MYYVLDELTLICAISFCWVTNLGKYADPSFRWYLGYLWRCFSRQGQGATSWVSQWFGAKRYHVDPAGDNRGLKMLKTRPLLSVFWGVPNSLLKPTLTPTPCQVAKKLTPSSVLVPAPLPGPSPSAHTRALLPCWAQPRSLCTLNTHLPSDP